jgi:putative glutamine amidotransferase
MLILLSLSSTEKQKGKESPYFKAMIAAGAKPEELRSVTAGDESALKAKCDGVVFTGGADVDPSLYDEKQQFDNVKTDLARDRFELALLDHALHRKMPILGICRGLQLINVKFNGTLYQDLDNQASPRLQHRQSTRTETTHEVTLTDPDSTLARSFRGSCRVNSLHHQAIRRLGRGLKATAHSEDGLIEAVESAAEYPFLLAVQWHPEEIVDRPEQKKILQEFIAACRKAESARAAAEGA